MADQKKWFKVWTSILSDDDFDPSRPASLEAVGRFVMLGAYAALHGNRGVVDIHIDTLLRIMNVQKLADLNMQTTFKNVSFEEGKNRHGKITVTINKWIKYQEDSTQAERAKTSRSKRRGEEKRREEIRKEEKRREEEGGSGGKQSSARVNPRRPTATDADWIESLKTNPAYRGLDIERVHGKMLAWCDLHRKNPTRKRLLNWLNREDGDMEVNGSKYKPRVDPKKAAAWLRGEDVFSEGEEDAPV